MNYSLKQPLLWAILSFMGLSACDNCLTKTGKIIETRRSIEDFESVLVYDNISLYLDEALDNEIKIIAGEHLQNLLDIQVDNKVLTLKNTAKCNWLRSYEHKIEIHVPSNAIKNIETWDFANLYTSQQIAVPNLASLRTYGTGNVNVHFVCDNMYLFSNSATSIHLKGSGNNVTLHTNGIGRIEAEEFQIQDCNVIHEHQNDILVFPIDSLAVDFRRNSKGHVIYYNEPKSLVVKRLGEGTIRKPL